MTPKQLINGLRSFVIDENVAIYRDLFGKTSVKETTDLYWKRALDLFNRLSPEQQETFFEIIRQIAVDTTSNILGVIDGVSPIKGAVGDISLLSDNKQKLSGDLQSLFLADEQKRTRNY